MWGVVVVQSLWLRLLIHCDQMIELGLSKVSNLVDSLILMQNPQKI